MARSPRTAPRRRPIAILPYGPSDSVNALRDSLSARGPETVRLRREDSTYRGRSGELVINWGNSTIHPGLFDSIQGQARGLNPPAAIARASNKIDAFRMMDEAGVPTVAWTVSSEVARAWINAGALVYARTRLQGHSGEGIVMSHRDPLSIQGVGNAFEVHPTVVQARLYTKGITEQRREFRIHVMEGVVTYVQQKKRAEGWQENPAYSNVVRNYHTGWIYAAMDVSPNQAALDAAVAAVRALGLNFGAVDVITRRDQAWVLEVNTAPGLQGTNLEVYTNNFLRIFNGQAPEVAPNLNSNPPLQGRGEDGGVPAGTTVEDRIAELAAFVGTTPTTREILQSIADVRDELRASQQQTPREILERAAERADIRRAEVERTIETLQQESVSVAAPTRPARGRSSIIPVHNAYYWATYENSEIIVQYNSEVEGFYMAGWEVPLTDGDGLVVDLSATVTR